MGKRAGQWKGGNLKRTPGATRRLSLSLRDIQREGEQPLDEVFTEALRVLNRIGVRPGEADEKGPLATQLCKPNWLAKWCIRAVCEAILAKGLMPLPLAVDLHWKDGTPGSALPCVVMPEAFRNLARKHGVKPQFLAQLVLNDYAANAPKKLTFRTGYPLDPGEFMDGR